MTPEAMYAVNEAAGKVGESMREMAKHSHSLSGFLVYVFQRAYAAAGYPYGNTPTGFRKWLRSEARRLKTEAPK